MEKGNLIILMFALVVLSGAVVGAVVYYMFRPPGEEEVYYLGHASHGLGNAWEAIYADGFAWYCEEHGYKMVFTDARYDSTLQAEQVRRLVDMGVDGLFMAPCNEKALNPTIEYAHDHGVPIITSPYLADSPYPVMTLATSFSEQGEIAAEHIVTYLEEEYGEPRGKVLNLRGITGTTAGDQRSDGFTDFLDDYPEIEVLTYDTEWSTTKAKTITEEVIPTGDIDAIYNANLAISDGNLAGLKALGKDPKDYYIVSLDAGPAVLDGVRAGEIDLCVGQPPQWYGVIAAEYLVRYLERGEEALPEVGDIVTAEDLDIQMKQRYGKDIYGTPVWAPAEVVDTYDYYGTEYHQKYLKIPNLIITEDNVDDPTIWGNLELPGW
jgi:ABC-type sugar transport system substrate-binding protein